MALIDISSLLQKQANPEQQALIQKLGIPANQVITHTEFIDLVVKPILELQGILADRSALNGMGYVILRKDKTFAEQVTNANTIYEIRYDFDLLGEDVEVGNNTLFFNGGSIRNGKIIFDNGEIISNYTSFINVECNGKILNNEINSLWFISPESNIDQTKRLNDLLTWACNISKNVYISPGIYNVSNTLYIWGTTCLRGEKETSIIEISTGGEPINGAFFFGVSPVSKEENVNVWTGKLSNITIKVSNTRINYLIYLPKFKNAEICNCIINVEGGRNNVNNKIIATGDNYSYTTSFNKENISIHDNIVYFGTENKGETFNIEERVVGAKIYNNYITTYADDVVGMHNGCSHIEIFGNVIYTDHSRIYCSDCDYVNIHDNRFECIGNNTCQGIVYEHEVGEPILRHTLTIANNTIINNAPLGYGIRVHSAIKNVKILNNNIIGKPLTVSHFSYEGFIDDESPLNNGNLVPRDVIISGNNSENAYIFAASNSLFNGNSIVSDNSFGIASLGRALYSNNRISTIEYDPNKPWNLRSFVSVDCIYNGILAGTKSLQIDGQNYAYLEKESLLKGFIYSSRGDGGVGTLCAIAIFRNDEQVYKSAGINLNDPVEIRAELNLRFHPNDKIEVKCLANYDGTIENPHVKFNLIYV